MLSVAAIKGVASDPGAWAATGIAGVSLAWAQLANVGAGADPANPNLPGGLSEAKIFTVALALLYIFDKGWGIYRDRKKEILKDQEASAVGRADKALAELAALRESSSRAEAEARQTIDRMERQAAETAHRQGEDYEERLKQKRSELVFRDTTIASLQEQIKSLLATQADLTRQQASLMGQFADATRESVRNTGRALEQTAARSLLPATVQLTPPDAGHPIPVTIQDTPATPEPEPVPPA